MHPVRASQKVKTTCEVRSSEIALEAISANRVKLSPQEKEVLRWLEKNESVAPSEEIVKPYIAPVFLKKICDDAIRIVKNNGDLEEAKRLYGIVSAIIYRIAIERHIDMPFDESIFCRVHFKVDLAFIRKEITDPKELLDEDATPNAASGCQKSEVSEQEN